MEYYSNSNARIEELEKLFQQQEERLQKLEKRTSKTQTMVISGILTRVAKAAARLFAKFFDLD